MSSAAIQKAEAFTAIEAVLVGGDLTPLTPEQRVNYYNRVCESVGLNPLTRPFDYLRLNNKLILYANKNCADQLMSTRSLSVEIPTREPIQGVFVVTARVKSAGGRAAEGIGAVPIEGLKGEALANAVMKAETTAKRRTVMSFCGLSMMDETEVDSVPGAQRVAAQPVAEPPVREPVRMPERKLPPASAPAPAPAPKAEVVQTAPAPQAAPQAPATAPSNEIHPAFWDEVPADDSPEAAPEEEPELRPGVDDALAVTELEVKKRKGKADYFVVHAGGEKYAVFEGGEVLVKGTRFRITGSHAGTYGPILDSWEIV